MTEEVVRQAATRIAEHAKARELPMVHVILHGGEPLLLGAKRLNTALTILRSTIESPTELDLRMQSNGVLLTEELCHILVAHQVQVGISLDGDRPANDRHRRFPNGESSHRQVLRALDLLRRPAFRNSFAGLLCTVDLANDPIAVYEALLAERPPRLDFLLPHATWESPPVRPAGHPAPYAEWLGRIYRRWLADGRPVPIRVFDSLISLARGGTSQTEAFGLDAADLVVIETDGAWEQADSTKTAYHGAPATGLDIFSHSASDAAEHSAIAARFGGAAALCDTCQACPVVRQCGGGLYAHRYRATSGFANPSVYCDDLKALIEIVTPPASPAHAAPEDPMPPGLLQAIASGYGDSASIQYLADTQVAFVRALLVAVAERVTGAAAESWKLLGQLERQAPQAVRKIFSHPYIRAWAAHCLENERADSDRLSCVTAAAVIRANVASDVAVPVSDGRVHLPTLGTVRGLPSTATDAVITPVPGGLTVRVGRSTLVIASDVATEFWEPTRHVAIDGLSLAIEDGDPYRDCHEWQPSPRLTEAQAGRWTRALTGAWRDIQRCVPGQVPGLRIGLAAVAPLIETDKGVHRAATSRHAFGALGATEVGADDLAVVLVHEFQHSKLGAVLDLVDLLDRGFKQRLRVGWRQDLRPAEGVLQGIYAHLGVADYWRARVALKPDPEGLDQFRRYREWTLAAIATLTSSGALTPTGEAFVTQIGEVIGGWSMDTD